MHLTLLVPGLLWPREILRDTTFDLPLPALSRLLARGRRSAVVDDDTWLADAFGVGRPMPSAALRLLGEGGQPAAHDWLCLDPVHIRIEQRAIVLDDPARLRLTADEDAALTEAVAPLFAGLGGIVAGVPGHWHMRLSRPAELDAAPLHAGVGRQINPAQPGGNDGDSWRRLLAEAQPLLHAHPVNRRREDEGRPTANSLWPWGGGRLPVGAQGPFRTLWSDDPVLKGLSALSGALAEPLPPRFMIVRGRVLARYEGLTGSLSSFDATTWRAALTTLEEDWLAPALSAVKGGVLRRLTLVMSGHDQTIQATIARGDLWRFWRKGGSLPDLGT